MPEELGFTVTLCLLGMSEAISRKSYQYDYLNKDDIKAHKASSSQRKYRQLKNAKSSGNSLPEGKAYQLVM